MNLIFASDESGLIGLNGLMPWEQKADLKRFKALTSFDHKGRMPCVIMGRKTYESVHGYDFPGRNKVIVSSGANEEANDRRSPRSELWRTVPEVLEFHKKVVASKTDVPFWVIGGSQIYTLLLPFVDTIYWTKIRTRVRIDSTDDAVYWNVPLFEFNCIEQSELYPADEENQFPYQFMKFKRMRQ